MRTMISALHFDWTDMADCFQRAAREFGLDGVELSLYPGGGRPHCTEQDIRQLRELARDREVCLTAHVWDEPAQLGPEGAAHAFLRWLDLCTQTGIEGLVLHGGSHPSPAEGLRIVREALGRVAGDFERAGVVLNLENTRGVVSEQGQQLFSRPGEFLEVLPAIDSPAVRFCLDTGHANITGNLKEFVQELAPFLNHIHLNDNHSEDDEHLPYGEGAIDWQGLFAALRDVAYDGTFCIEFPVREDSAPLERCLRDIRAAFCGVRGHAPGAHRPPQGVDGDLVQVFSTDDPTEAALVRLRLDEAQVAYVAANEVISAVCPVDGMAEVRFLVPRGQLARAREALRRHRGA